jgi:hypothetical protein
MTKVARSAFVGAVLAMSAVIAAPSAGATVSGTPRHAIERKCPSVWQTPPKPGCPFIPYRRMH